MLKFLPAILNVSSFRKLCADNILIILSKQKYASITGTD